MIGHDEAGHNGGPNRHSERSRGISRSAAGAPWAPSAHGHGGTEAERDSSAPLGMTMGGYRCEYGSNASRNPSPTKLMLMTVRKTIRPGAMAKTGWVRMKAWASL